MLVIITPPGRHVDFNCWIFFAVYLILYISQCYRCTSVSVTFFVSMPSNTQTTVITLFTLEKHSIFCLAYCLFFFLKVNLSFQLDEQQRFPCGTHLDSGKHKVHGCTLPWRQTSGFLSNDVLLKEYRDKDKMSTERGEMFLLSNSNCIDCTSIIGSTLYCYYVIHYCFTCPFTVISIDML